MSETGKQEQEQERENEFQWYDRKSGKWRSQSDQLNAHDEHAKQVIRRRCPRDEAGHSWDSFGERILNGAKGDTVIKRPTQDSYALHKMSYQTARGTKAVAGVIIGGVGGLASDGVSFAASRAGNTDLELSAQEYGEWFNTMLFRRGFNTIKDMNSPFPEGEPEKPTSDTKNEGGWFYYTSYLLSNTANAAYKAASSVCGAACERVVQPAVNTAPPAPPRPSVARDL